MKEYLKKTCFLCGMMGTGKSVVGKKIAGKLNLPFHDLDLLIEAEAGMKIPDIFELQGERCFRNMEKKILKGFTGDEPGILALGGGSLQNQEITTVIKSSGILIFMDTHVDILTDRLRAGKNRPMIKNLNPMELKLRIGSLLKKRIPFYSQAHITVQCDRMSADEIADRIIEKLDEYDF